MGKGHYFQRLRGGSGPVRRPFLTSGDLGDILRAECLCQDVAHRWHLRRVAWSIRMGPEIRKRYAACQGGEKVNEVCKITEAMQVVAGLTNGREQTSKTGGNEDYRRSIGKSDRRGVKLL